LYGDMAGGYSVLKDAYKTTVFALSRWRNSNKPETGLGPDGRVMPEPVITKPPAAGLRPGQKDEDSLPPYSALDRILEGLVEKEMSVGEVANATGEDIALVADIESKLLKAEYKRRQAPPGVKIGTRNFGRDRRYPISNFFRTGKWVDRLRSSGWGRRDVSRRSRLVWKRPWQADASPVRLRADGGDARRTHRTMGPGAGPVACRTDAYGRRARSGAARTRAGSPHRGRMVGCDSMPGQTHDRDHVRPISAERIGACAAIVRKPQLHAAR